MKEDSLPPDWWTENYNPLAALGMYRIFDDDDLIPDSTASELEQEADPYTEEEDPRFR